MAKYRVTFECYVVVNARNATKAIQEAWLQKNIDEGSYKYMTIRKVAE